MPSGEADRWPEDASTFGRELESARAFERLELQRHRGLVELWIGLTATMAGGNFLVGQLDGGTSNLEYAVLGAGLAAYLIALFAAWLPFRFHHRWKGVWAKANSWHWGSLGGFLGAWYVLFSLAGLLSFVLVPRGLDAMSPDDFRRSMAAVQLVAIALSILFINLWAKDRLEVIVALGMVLLGVAALASWLQGPGVAALLGLACFAPMLVLALYRLRPRRAGSAP